MPRKYSWPRRSAWWWVLVLVLVGLFGGLSAHSEESQLPTLEEPLLNPQLEQLLNLPWRTLLDDSMLLVTRLRERRQQAGSLVDSLSAAGGKLSYSEELSLRLEQLLSGALPLLQSLQTDLTGISSSLSGLRTDFSGLSSSLNGYFDLMQDQVREIRGERDAALRILWVWRFVAIGGITVGVAAVIVIVVLLVK
jgi:hypothetical protein